MINIPTISYQLTGRKCCHVLKGNSALHTVDNTNTHLLKKRPTYIPQQKEHYKKNPKSKKQKIKFKTLL